MVKNAGASPTGPGGNRFSGPLTPGRRDGLGERWSTIWAADGSPVELLQLRSEVTSAPGVERALRDRVTQLASFTHPAFASVRELYQDDATLTLVSTRVSGQRLSELTTRDVPKAGRPAFVVRLLQQLSTALAALEEVGHGVTHGALTADRIFITAGGVCITEHVFASALQQLALWPEEFFLQFGLLVPAEEDEQAAFVARTTVMQLAVVALSLLLDRPVTQHDIEHRLQSLIEEVETSASASMLASPVITPLRTWLGQALQLQTPGYASAAEAGADLKQLLLLAGSSAAAEVEGAPFAAPPQPRLVSRTDEDPRAATREAPVHTPVPVGPSPAPVAMPRQAATALHTTASVLPALLPEPLPPAPVVSHPVPFLSSMASPAESAAGSGMVPRYFVWAAALLAVLVVAEGAAIAWLMNRRPPAPVEPAVTIESAQPGTTVTVDGRPAGTTPLKLQVTANTRAIRLIPAEPVAPPPLAAAATPVRPPVDQTAALEQAAARQRSGGVAFVAPIPLNVLEGDRVLGSTADGPVVATAGTHTLDLVNAALGYRVRQVVTIRAGAIARVPITPPMGRISINAQPWAQVLIDDTAVGETPLANVPVSLGDHQITFRHPQFGERRERVVVRADAPARVSTSFQR